MTYVLVIHGPDSTPVTQLQATWDAAELVGNDLRERLSGGWSIYAHHADGTMDTRPMAMPGEFERIDLPDSLPELAHGNCYVLLENASEEAAVLEAAEAAGCSGAALGFVL